MLWKKMKLQEGTTIIAVNAPSDYKKILGELPQSVTIKNKPEKENDFIHLFVKNKAELEKEIVKVIKNAESGRTSLDILSERTLRYTNGSYA